MNAWEAWPLQLIPLGGVSMGTVVWRMGLRGEVTTHVTVVVAASFGYGVRGGLQRVRSAPLTREAGDGPGRLVPASSDLAPYLPEADVWLEGHAHAPEAVQQLDVGLEVRSAEGQPRLSRWLRVADPPGGWFRRMPLVWERAAAGPDNPLGSAAPSVSALDDGAACLERIPTDFPPRSAVGDPRGAGILEVPAEFDWAFFQAVPPSQRGPFLRGDEQLTLVGLHPEASRIDLALPHLRAEVRILCGGRVESLTMWCDGLGVHSDQQRVTLRWRGLFPIAGLEAIGSLRAVGAVVSHREPVDWPRVIASLSAAAVPFQGLATHARETQDGEGGSQSLREGEAEDLAERGEEGTVEDGRTTVPDGPAPEALVRARAAAARRDWSRALSEAEGEALRAALGLDTERAPGAGVLGPAAIPGAPWSARVGETTRERLPPDSVTRPHRLGPERRR